MLRIYDKHIDYLCRKHDIKRFATSKRGRAHVELRQVAVPEMVDEMSYFVALHEIGHIMIGLEYPRLEREAKAWDWALENARVKPNYRTRQRICANLYRYLCRAEQEGWRRPPPESRFWQLLRWWEVPDGKEDSKGK
jgi:predicted SprT family Zn-dependent metalloprotease